MTTPAKNEIVNRVEVFTFVTKNRFTGAVLDQGTQTFVRRRSENVRPASGKSAKRPDGTRRPRSWEHRWCWTNGGSGSLTKNTGTVGVHYTTGELLLNGATGSPTITQVSGQLNNARLSALAKATEGTRQLNAALAQSRDLVRMSGDYLKRANKGLEDLIDLQGKKKLRGFKNSWKKLPDEYLAYLYGIAPLGDDIANGFDQLSRMRSDGNGMHMILKAKKSFRESFTESNHVRDGTGTAGIRVSGRRTTVCSVGYRFDIPSWYLDRAPPVSLFSTAYELAPYSFVLDWFLPIGDWIGSLESAQYSPFFTEGFETWMVKEFVDLTSATVPTGGALQLTGRLERGRMVRTALQVYPSSVTTRPALKPFPGINQISQGLALLTQKLKRLR